MPSYIQPTFKIATVASGCYRRWLGLFNFCGHSLLMAPTRARSLVEHWRRTSLGSKHKSSSVPIKQKALRFCPNAGSLSVRLPGSTVAGGSPKTSKTSTAMHWLSSVWRPFALWSEGYVFPDELLGRTLRDDLRWAVDGPPIGVWTTVLGTADILMRDTLWLLSDGAGYLHSQSALHGTESFPVMWKH